MAFGIIIHSGSHDYFFGVAGIITSIGTFLKTMTWFYQTMTLFYQSSAIVLSNIDVVLTFDWDDTEKNISLSGEI